MSNSSYTGSKAGATDNKATLSIAPEIYAATGLTLDDLEPLTDADLERLENRHWIDRQTAEEAGLCRISSAAVSRICSTTDNGRLGGIFIPYLRPGSKEVIHFRIELDAERDSAHEH
ncbi:MAG: hypothetical protein WB676_21260 [Bryobacteraceae bacterium]